MTKVTVKCFFFQRHHRWWGVCRWAESDSAFLCSCVSPPNPEGDKLDCMKLKSWDADDWITCKTKNFFLPQVDVASLITQKLLKVSMKHIEIISKARQKGIADMHHPLTPLLRVHHKTANSFCPPSAVKNTECLQQAALEEYGPDLHVALRSRRDELLYLRKLTEMLFPYILPPKATDCR